MKHGGGTFRGQRRLFFGPPEISNIPLGQLNPKNSRTPFLLLNEKDSLPLVTPCSRENKKRKVTCANSKSFFETISKWQLTESSKWPKIGISVFCRWKLRSEGIMPRGKETYRQMLKGTVFHMNLIHIVTSSINESRKSD